MSDKPGGIPGPPEDEDGEVDLGISLPAVANIIDAARASPRDRARNACLLELLYATGMRVSELVSLPVAAARGDPRAILVAGKGGKERLVPLSAPARAALLDWLGERDVAEEARFPGRAPSRFLFPSRGTGGHLTRQGFFALIKDLAVRAGVPVERVRAAFYYVRTGDLVEPPALVTRPELEALVAPRPCSSTTGGASGGPASRYAVRTPIATVSR